MSLHRLITDRIRASGPISIAEYMTECLLHPQHGYYTTRDPLGRAGDFITAPEISQMFGELIGLALAQCWIDQGRPPAITLAELGPGRGTLMADALRAAASVPGFTKAAHIVLIEASPTLRSLQQQALAGHDVTWTDSISDLPDQPLFLIANEFFDALPIRQFIRDENLWRERRVGVQDGTLGFGLGTPMPQPGLAHRLADTADGDLVEHCAPLTAITESIAARIAAHGGAALIIDYGDWRTLGDTLQAIRDHAPVDPLIDPGQCDLTAHVDFEALALAATPCQYTRLTPQGMFLERLGITNRAQTLAKSLSGPQLDEMVAAHRRLTHPEEMGNLFKVIGLYPAQAAPPPGLNP